MITNFITLLKKESTKEEQIHFLKNEANCHFLFNNLNQLLYYIDSNQKSADEFIFNLANFYRYFLEVNRKDTIPLKEEVAFAKKYVSLCIEPHYQNNFGVSFNIENCFLEEKVIPLTLVQLIENAVKHNTISKNCPLSVQVYSKNGCVFVKNNLKKKKIHSIKSNGIGLLNLNQQFQLFFKKSISTIKSKTCFIVKIPLVS